MSPTSAERDVTSLYIYIVYTQTPSGLVPCRKQGPEKLGNGHGWEIVHDAVIWYVNQGPKVGRVDL